MGKIDIEDLRKHIGYDPETGRMWWIVATAHAVKSGDPAFSICSKNGYLHGSFRGVKTYAHRIAFAHYHGAWAPYDIDHINGDRTDNRIENLRSVNRSDNNKNARRAINNTSGVTGVHFDLRHQRWMAHIKSDQKFYFLGYFDSKSDAIAARKAAEIKHGFHPNHGRAVS
jgi:hypothetical protein